MPIAAACAVEHVNRKKTTVPTALKVSTTVSIGIYMQYTTAHIVGRERCRKGQLATVATTINNTRPPIKNVITRCSSAAVFWPTTPRPAPHTTTTPPPLWTRNVLGLEDLEHMCSGVLRVYLSITPQSHPKRDKQMLCVWSVLPVLPTTRLHTCPRNADPSRAPC